MTGYSPHMKLYDDMTDVMYFGIGESAFTNEREVAPGIHVLYAYDNGTLDDIVAVEIEYFKERYGDGVSEITVPADPPFVVSV